MSTAVSLQCTPRLTGPAQKFQGSCGFAVEKMCLQAYMQFIAGECVWGACV